MIKVGWKLILVTFFMNIWGKIDGDIISPFLNSRVHCCGGEHDAPMLTEHYDITNNATRNFFAQPPYNLVDEYGHPLEVIKACEIPAITDHDDSAVWAHWSLSGNCVNKAYVLDMTQFTRGYVYQMGNWFAILILPLGGHVGDCWGRKKVYWWTTFCLIGVAALYWADCLTPGGSTHGPIFILIAAVVNSGWQPHGPAGQAMIVDMMHSTRLGSCLPIMQVVSQLGPWLGNIMLVVVVSLGLTDYRPVWGTLTFLGVGVLLFMWWGIFETLPEGSRKPFEPMKWLKEYFLCFALLKRDFVLMKIWFMIFFMWTANGGWMTSYLSYMVNTPPHGLGFTQAEALIPNSFSPLSRVIAGALAVKFLPKIGGWTGYVGGLWVNVFSTFMMGVGGFLGAGIGYYTIWFALVVTVPIHETMNYNGYTMITACRVDHKNQVRKTPSWAKSWANFSLL
jgi:MFS family permease